LLAWAQLDGSIIVIVIVDTDLCTRVFIQVKKRPDFEERTPVTQLAFSFMTSLTITALNSIVPIIFKKIVKLEGYSFAVEVNVTLIRYMYYLPVIQC